MTRLTLCGSRATSCIQAGLVTSVSTRTSIIGAINPRPAVLHASMPWASRPLTDVTGLEGPLLSRFDLVLLLADPRHPDWDRTVAGHVLARSAAAAPSGVGDGELATGAAALLPSCSGPALPLALPSTEALSATPPEPRHVNVTMVAPAGARRGGAQGSGFAEGSQAAGGGARVTIAEMVAARLGGGGDGAGGGMGAAVAPGTSVSGVVAAAQGRLGPFGSQQQTARAGMASSVTAPNGEVKCGSSSRNSSAWTLDVIRAYIDWAKQRPAPIMSPEVSTCFGTKRTAVVGLSFGSTILHKGALWLLSRVHAAGGTSLGGLLRGHAACRGAQHGEVRPSCPPLQHLNGHSKTRAYPVTNTCPDAVPAAPTTTYVQVNHSSARKPYTRVTGRRTQWSRQFDRNTCHVPGRTTVTPTSATVRFSSTSGNAGCTCLAHPVSLRSRHTRG